MLYTRDTSDRMAHRLRAKGQKKEFHENGNKQKAGVAILTSDKMDFKKTEETQMTKLKRQTHRYAHCSIISPRYGGSLSVHRQRNG